MNRAVYLAGQVWMSPVTAFGLLQTLAGARFHSRSAEGVLQFVAHPRGPLGWYMRKLNIAAYTLGGVVTYRDANLPHDPRLYRHEFEHVLQTMRWGPLMPVAYAASSLWQVIRGRALYRDNWFEVHARAAEQQPLPPLRAVRSESTFRT